ncbi:BRD8 protein, partial [Atractosteus spatula]|nr:BRD8 protein [Atractosteus spatula]
MSLGPTEPWSVREKLCLASSVMRSGDQNWVSVSRAIKPFAEAGRPPDWFSQKHCASQYSELLETTETPKRKRGEKGEVVETVEDVIVRRLTAERIDELKRLIKDTQELHRKLKKEAELIQAGHLDNKLEELWGEIVLKKKQDEEEAELKRKATDAAYQARQAVKNTPKRVPSVTVRSPLGSSSPGLDFPMADPPQPAPEEAGASLKKEAELIQAGHLDNKLEELWGEIVLKKKQDEEEAELKRKATDAAYQARQAVKNTPKRVPSVTVRSPLGSSSPGLDFPMADPPQPAPEEAGASTPGAPVFMPLTESAGPGPLEPSLGPLLDDSPQKKVLGQKVTPPPSPLLSELLKKGSLLPTSPRLDSQIKFLLSNYSSLVVNYKQTGWVRDLAIISSVIFMYIISNGGDSACQMSRLVNRYVPVFKRIARSCHSFLGGRTSGGLGISGAQSSVKMSQACVLTALMDISKCGTDLLTVEQECLVPTKTPPVVIKSNLRAGRYIDQVLGLAQWPRVGDGDVPAGHMTGAGVHGAELQHSGPAIPASQAATGNHANDTPELHTLLSTLNLHHQNFGNLDSKSAKRRGSNDPQRRDDFRQYSANSNQENTALKSHQISRSPSGWGQNLFLHKRAQNRLCSHKAVSESCLFSVRAVSPPVSADSTVILQCCQGELSLLRSVLTYCDPAVLSVRAVSPPVSADSTVILQCCQGELSLLRSVLTLLDPAVLSGRAVSPPVSADSTVILQCCQGELSLLRSVLTLAVLSVRAVSPPDLTLCSSTHCQDLTLCSSTHCQDLTLCSSTHCQDLTLCSSTHCQDLTLCSSTHCQDLTLCSSTHCQDLTLCSSTHCQDLTLCSSTHCQDLTLCSSTHLAEDLKLLDFIFILLIHIFPIVEFLDVSLISANLCKYPSLSSMCSEDQEAIQAQKIWKKSIMLVWRAAANHRTVRLHWNCSSYCIRTVLLYWDCSPYCNGTVLLNWDCSPYCNRTVLLYWDCSPYCNRTVLLYWTVAPIVTGLFYCTGTVAPIVTELFYCTGTVAPIVTGLFYCTGTVAPIVTISVYFSMPRYANVFLQPVTDDIAPGYHSIVHRPMDLSTIKKNIENGLIRTTAEFQRDIMLMFQNAVMYNSSDHDVYHMALEMQRDVLEQIQQFLATQLIMQTSESGISAKSLRGRDSTRKQDSSDKVSAEDERTATSVCMCIHECSHAAL